MVATNKQAKDFAVRMAKILRAATNEEPLPSDAKILLQELRAAGENYSADNLEKAIKNW